jgi:hypothetical protein
MNYLLIDASGYFEKDIKLLPENWKNLNYFQPSDKWNKWIKLEEIASFKDSCIEWKEEELDVSHAHISPL